MGRKKPPDIQNKINHQPMTSKLENFWEKLIFQRHLVIKPTEDTNDLIYISTSRLNTELSNMRNPIYIYKKKTRRSR